jgi:glycosyltransferase involved in cell wall biosynthesis
MNTSIVLMSYNQEEYVAESVMSVLTQEGPPLEIILSDDCSTDATFEIMQKIVDAYSGPHRVILRRNDVNQGLIRHYRTVFELSSGDVIIVAAGDDLSLPDRAVLIREVFDTTDAWLVYSHATCIDTEGQEIPPMYLGAKLHQGADLETIAVATSLYVGATGAYRRELFQKYGQVTNPRALEDLIFGFRAALENRIRFIDRPLIRYRVGSGLTTWFLRASAAEKRKAHVRKLRTQQAVLSQRRRDTKTFGLRPRDRIPKLIREQRIMLLFQLFFFCDVRLERCMRPMLRHPVLAYRSFQLFQNFDRKSQAAARAEARNAARARQ